MKKKIFAASLALALVALALGGGSLAYFTSTATVTNTFTVGNVEIETLISKYHRAAQNPASPLYTEGGVYEGSADNVAAVKNGHETAFTDKYISDAFLEADAANYSTYQATVGQNMVPGANVHFNPFIKNTGKNAAYVRMHVLVPVSLFTIIDNGPTYQTSTALNEGEITSKAYDYYLANGYTVSDTYKVNRNGVDYYDFDWMYTDAIEPGEITFWNPWGNIAIDKNATQDQIANAEFDIIVEAEGVQADGFASAAAAFAATFDKK